jgi:hypothetical protein
MAHQNLQAVIAPPAADKKKGGPMKKENQQRKVHDRREEESGPPHGWKDRRRRTERRIPEIVEFVATESEWLMYFGPASQPDPAANVRAGSEATDIFDHLRD